MSTIYMQMSSLSGIGTTQISPLRRMQQKYVSTEECSIKLDASFKLRQIGSKNFEQIFFFKKIEFLPKW